MRLRWVDHSIVYNIIMLYLREIVTYGYWNIRPVHYVRIYSEWDEWCFDWGGYWLVRPVIFSLIKYCFVLKSRGWITIIVQNKICQSRVWCTNICMMVVDYLSDSVVKTGYKTLTVFSCVCLLEKVVREIWDNIMVLLHWLKRFEKFGVLIFQKRSMFDCSNLIYLFDIRNVWTSCCSCLKFEIRGCILWN